MCLLIFKSINALDYQQIDILTLWIRLMMTVLAIRAVFVEMFYLAEVNKDCCHELYLGLTSDTYLDNLLPSYFLLTGYLD